MFVSQALRKARVPKPPHSYGIMLSWHFWSLNVSLFYCILFRSCFLLFYIQHFQYLVLEGFSWNI